MLTLWISITFYLFNVIGKYPCIALYLHRKRRKLPAVIIWFINAGTAVARSTGRPFLTLKVAWTIRNNVDAGTGTLAIHSSTINKNVNAGSCAFAISSSKVKGTLTAQSDNLKIGNDCEINNLVIKKENSPAGIESSQNNGEASTQKITLGPGTTLNKMSFDADFCFLTLKGNASYQGTHIPGLQITRVP